MKTMRKRHIVGIQYGDVRGRTSFQTEVQRPGASQSLAMYDRETRVLEFIKNLSREIGRPVVDHDDLKLLCDLRQCACDGGLHVFPTIVHRHQYRGPHDAPRSESKPGPIMLARVRHSSRACLERRASDLGRVW